jgi:multidrug transporter EmrE-like cation transporter
MVYLSPLLVAAYAAILFASLADLRLGEALGRYTLGLVGAGLAAIAFFKLAVTLRRLSLARAASDAQWVGLGFAFYAVFAGILYSPMEQPIVLLGIPVQIYRAACAVLISVFVVRILSFFRK